MSDSNPIPLDDAGVSTVTLEAINARFKRGSERMDNLEASMRINTAMTSDVHEVLMAARSGINAIAKFGRGLAMVGRWLVKAIKPLAVVAAAYVAVKHDVSELLHRAADIFKP